LTGFEDSRAAPFGTNLISATGNGDRASAGSALIERAAGDVADSIKGNHAGFGRESSYGVTRDTKNVSACEECRRNLNRDGGVRGKRTPIRHGCCNDNRSAGRWRERRVIDAV